MKNLLKKGFERIYDISTGAQTENWSRVVMHEKCKEIVASFSPDKLSVLEISGDRYRNSGFNAYSNANYPDFDICKQTVQGVKYDLIIAEQVFEHLIYPYKACRNVLDMLNANGSFLISVPFLVSIHNYPIDCTRWTETGLKYFLEECGFPLDQIRTWSWGNQACVKANFSRWVKYRSRLHSLQNETKFPYHVWAIARK